MANYTSGRHKFARGPVTDQVKAKLVAMIKAAEEREREDSKKEEPSANAPIEPGTSTAADDQRSRKKELTQ